MTTAGLVLADGWGMHGDVGAGWWIVMMLGMVVFWGAIILLIVWLVRGGFESRRPEAPSAKDILERRFAEGALTVDDYRARREVLANGSAASGEEPKAVAGVGEGSER
jgi:putative membrane protein